MAHLPHLWPDDYNGTAPAVEAVEPDTELAVMLLAAGVQPEVIREKCGFSTLRACRAFLREPEVAAGARSLQAERIERLGNAGLVRLEGLLAADMRETDMRALVLAIRTAFDVSGLARREQSPPVRRVEELTVGELAELIESTKAEITRRVASQPNAPLGITSESTG